METVNNIVTTASAAIWGENGAPHDDEPMSGVQGKGSADDPYDAGNRDEQPGSSPTDASDTVPKEERLDDKTESSTSNNGQQMSEQRNADNTTADAESSSSSDEQIPRSALEDPNVHVSEEALKGPQGPAPPHSAEEFEQELKGNGKPPLGTDQDLLGKGDASSKNAGSKTHDDGHHAGQTAGKQGTMSKMKERLNKVTHLHHSSK